MADRYARSRALLKRARKVIPGGVWGHQRFPAFLDHGHYPYFATRGEGARFQDVDGNWYIDYLCGFGAMINGHANSIVDEAVVFAARRGDSLDLPTELSVELAELICAQTAQADWCCYGKNGTDAVQTAIQVARAHTLRRRVACARGSLHGAAAPEGEGALRFAWNDGHALRSLFERQGEEVAAILIPAIHQPLGGPAASPEPAFLDELRMVSREWGAVLIVDDVRTGLRVDMRGTHSTFGLEADLTCLSRAIGNGWPLSVVVGQEHLRQSASSIPTGGAFWNAPSAFAAAHANLRLLAENDGIARMNRLGRKLTLGLTRLGRQHGIEVQLSGPPSEPTVTLADDPQGRSMGWFAREMVALGSFVHPAHPWYLSTAHTEGHIEETLGHANRVLGYLARAREGMRRQAEEHTESLSASPPASPAVEARGPQGPSTPPEEGDTAPRRIEPSPRRRDDGQ